MLQYFSVKFFEFRAVLNYFFLQNKCFFFQSDDIPEGTTTLTTVGGEEVIVKRNHEHITVTSSAGSASVIHADILATNGVIHAINTVI